MPALVLGAAAAIAAGVAAGDEPVTSKGGGGGARQPATLVVHVVDASGHPVPDAAVVVRPALRYGIGDAAPVTASARGDGSYDVTFAGGDWRVDASAGSRRATRDVHVDPGTGADIEVTVR